MKVAIIGRGFGKHVMAPAFAGLGWQVDLVPSRDADAVRLACAARPDLVAVHSPPFQHQEHVEMALAEGLPVLCEKPFGRNVAEAEAMRDAAKAAGVLHFLNFEFRASPARVKAKTLIDAGVIGALTHISWANIGAGMRGRPHGWINRAELGGGWIGASGSHAIDALRFFFDDEVADCGGITRIETPDRPDADGKPVACTAEDAFSAWFRMNNGGTASIDSAYSASVQMPGVNMLMGSHGAIALNGENAITLHTKGHKEDFDLTAEARGHTFAAVPLWLEQVTQSLKDGQQVTPNFDDGLAVARVIELLKGSASKV